MLTYKAGYKFVEGRVFAQVLDFPAAMTEDETLPAARQMLVSALLDVADCHIDEGQALPLPNSSVSEDDFDLVEPIHLMLQASTQVKRVAAGAVAP
jgi:hypothetical protein